MHVSLAGRSQDPGYQDERERDGSELGEWSDGALKGQHYATDHAYFLLLIKTCTDDALTRSAFLRVTHSTQCSDVPF